MSSNSFTYQEITRLRYAEVSRDEYDRRLTDLVLAVRRDLKLRPDDDSSTFSFHMIAPYRNNNAAEQIVGREREGDPWSFCSVLGRRL